MRKKTVSKTKAYVPETNISLREEIDMNVPRKKVDLPSVTISLYLPGLINLNSIEELKEKWCAFIDKSYGGIVRARGIPTNISVNGYHAYLKYEREETEQEYETRRAKVIKGRMAAAKRKMGTEQKRIEKQKKEVSDLLKKLDPNTIDFLVQQLKVIDPKTS